MSLVGHDRVVQRTVRLDVADLRAARRTKGLQSAKLIKNEARQIARGNIVEDAAKIGQVLVGHVGANRDVVFCREANRRRHH